MLWTLSSLLCLLWMSESEQESDALACAVIQIFAGYIGSVSTIHTVKWLWFLIYIAALAGVVFHLVRFFKASADAKGGDLAMLYGCNRSWLEPLLNRNLSV